MSYDCDLENLYMVEFESGRIIYVGQYTVQDVIEYCADEHENQVIKYIYKEVYVGQKETEDA